MLARPGFIGSGLKAEAWWTHAVFYQIAGVAPDFKAISARLDSLRSLGVDALVLPAPALPAPGTNGSMPNLDDLDNLLRQASGCGIRVLLTIQSPSASAGLSGVARFWLTRGVAGLHVATPAGTSAEDTQAIEQTLRKMASSAAGQRIVISDLDLAMPAVQRPSKSPHTTTSHGRSADSSTAQLQIDVRADRLQILDAASLRPLLTQAMPNLLLDLHAPASATGSTDARPPLADAVATIALLGQATSLIDSGANLILTPAAEHSEALEQSEQPTKPTTPPPVAPPPGVYLPYVPYVPPSKSQPVAAPKPVAVPVDPLTAWYQKLAALHHDNPAFRGGSRTFLDFDAQNVLVWVNRPAMPSPHTPPIVVLCNLSSSPVHLSLTAEIKKLNLRGFFLRAVLRSDTGMGAQDVDAVTLPPFGAYIGELRM